MPYLCSIKIRNKQNAQQAHIENKADMETKTITPTSKKELKDAVTCILASSGETFYNWFKGDIRKGDRYARVTYWYEGHNLKILITYWRDGFECAVEYASTCTSHRSLVSKVAKFLNLK